MKTLAESLKRLYENKKITLEQVQERLNKGVITSEEYKEITGKDLPA